MKLLYTACSRPYFYISPQITTSVERKLWSAMDCKHMNVLMSILYIVWYRQRGFISSWCGIITCTRDSVPSWTLWCPLTRKWGRKHDRWCGGSGTRSNWLRAAIHSRSLRKVSKRKAHWVGLSCVDWGAGMDNTWRDTWNRGRLHLILNLEDTRRPHNNILFSRWLLYGFRCTSKGCGTTRISSSEWNYGRYSGRMYMWDKFSEKTSVPKSESPTSRYSNNILVVGFGFYNYSTVIPFLRGMPTLVL